MNLLVDLGNTRIKWAQSSPGVWRTATSLLEDQAIGTLLDREWTGLASPAKVVVASVASTDKREKLERWMEHRWAVSAHVVRAQEELLGVRNEYREPATLGADRWAALIAARHLIPGPVCVVDCGTAVTVDALSGDGRFIGGVIFPGLRLLRTSLVHATNGIREMSGSDTDCVARSTADGVAAGASFGLTGAIERVLEEYRNRLGPDMDVLLTGADAPIVSSKLRAPAREVPDLVLKGLGVIADKVA